MEIVRQTVVSSVGECHHPWEGGGIGSTLLTLLFEKVGKLSRHQVQIVHLPQLPEQLSASGSWESGVFTGP